MNVDQLTLEKRMLRLAIILPVLGAMAFGAVAIWFWILMERQEALLSPEPEDEFTVSINESTCASTRCHPVLEEAPITSRHAAINCVTCHQQRRTHAAECVECHDHQRHHSADASTKEVAVAEMARVKEEMKKQHEAAEADRDSEAAKAFPEAVGCVTCHLELHARPVTFAQVELAVHLPEDKTAEDCAGCHRPHDPKPLLGHPVPTDECRRGRDCCLACHVEELDESGEVLDEPLDLTWTDAQFQSWAVEEFNTEEIKPPRVPADHGHEAVECIACHGDPRTFLALANHVHNFETDIIRCGQCHTGATIIDQQVAQARLKAAEQSVPTETH